MKFIELVFGFSNALLGIFLTLYVARSLRKSGVVENHKLVSFIKTTLFAIIFVSAYSLFHFVREIFDLKAKYGPLTEIPEYASIFIVYLILIGQVVFFDAPDELFR